MWLQLNVIVPEEYVEVMEAELEAIGSDLEYVLPQRIPVEVSWVSRADVRTGEIILN